MCILKAHMAMVHKIGKPITPKRREGYRKEMIKAQCDICSKVLNAYSLKRHMIIFHTDPEKKEELLNELDKSREYRLERIVCSDCGQVVRRAHMKKHQARVHQKVKRFWCDICGVGELENSFLYCFES